jgi:hypothetical protein
MTAHKGQCNYHVVMCSATMISSLSIRAVKDIDTMCRNSFSKSTRDMIMMAAPVGVVSCEDTRRFMVKRTLIDTDHEPLEEGLVREGSALEISLQSCVHEIEITHLR